MYDCSINTTKSNKSRLTIGRSDRATFPEFELKFISIKVDSGAYTSAIHCCQIKLAPNDKLQVIFLDENDPNYTGKVFEFEEFKTKDVRSSNGSVENRFIISTTIRLFETLFDIDLSLTFRGDMSYPVLLGRKFLSDNGFIINPKLKNSNYKRIKKKMRKTNGS